MQKLPFRLTSDLAAAVLAITGAEPTQANPVVVLAAYVDALAKEYGLSESLALDVDPMERAEQFAPVMAIVKTGLSESGNQFDADSVRARLYEVFKVIAADPEARKLLNRNRPLSESGVLHLAQVYWNLEANPERPKLPIRPAEGRDIPVPGSRLDFATMTWTARVNQKGSYKSSGQGFRVQGARLAVLVARHLAANSSLVPDSSTGVLTVARTDDPDNPLEITLKTLVEQAWFGNEYETAADLATSYVRMIERRAEANPFELERDLAEAYLLKGHTSFRRSEDWKRPGLDIRPEAADDLEKAVRSLTMLSELDPDNDELRGNLAYAYFSLSEARYASGSYDEAAEAARQAVSQLDGLAAPQTGARDRQQQLVLALSHAALQEALSGAGRFDEAAAAAERAISVLERLVGTQQPDSQDEATLLGMQGTLSKALQAAGRSDDAIRAATRAVDLAEQMVASNPVHLRNLCACYVGLSDSLRSAGRSAEALEAVRRAVSLAEGFASANAEDAEGQLLLVLMLSALARTCRGSDHSDEAVVASGRAVVILESLAVEQPTTEYHERLGMAVSSLRKLLGDAGRHEEAALAANRAVEIYTDLAMAEPENSDYRSGLESSLYGLALCLVELRRLDDADAVLEQLRELGFD